MTEATGRGEARQMGRKHVFVVNGAPEFLGLMRELLQDEAFNVTTTNYIPETFDGIAALAPDLVVVDLVVGQRAGWELLERLQEAASTRGLPVIITSTDRRLLDRARADPERYGAHRTFVKPFDVDELMALIHEVIGAA